MKTAHIIVGHDGPGLSELLGFLTSNGEYRVKTARRGHQVIEAAKISPLPDLLVIENTVADPDAVEVCRAFKSDPLLTTVPILLVAVKEDQLERNLALLSGCDDILAGPATAQVLMARVRSLLRLKFLADESDSAEAVLATLARAIEAKDPHTLGHADRVSHFAVELGRALGVDGAELEVLRKGGLLHDVGKIAIPDLILLKPGKYSPEEFALMKRHPMAGCDICGSLKSVRDALPIIRHHHEKLDGTGYPDGLQGEAIPALVRVVTIVDIYDALRSKRTYKEAFAIDRSFQIMWEEAEKGWWDKSILSTWEKIVRAQKIDLLAV